MAQLFRFPHHFLLYIAVLLCCIAPGTSLARSLHLSDSLNKHRLSGRLSETVAKQLDRNGYAEVLVSLDDSTARELAVWERRYRLLDKDDHEILRKKASLHRERKQRLLSTLAPDDHEVLKDYGHFGVMYLKVSDKALARLLDDPEVVGVHENRRHELFLAESLPLIGQPAAAARGYTGAGSVVAVLDTGIDYTLSAFGSCTVPGSPASCRVLASVESATPDSNSRDDHGHGTNVAGIIAGVAPDVKLISLDVFAYDQVEGKFLAKDSAVLSALDWLSNNLVAYHTTAVNMSFGRDSYNSHCDSDVLAEPLISLRMAGVLATAASGNLGVTGSLPAPACVTGVVSVGAVYDADSIWSTITWTDPTPDCTDTPVNKDSVTCFTNISDLLTLVAPGSRITAAGISLSGTSQAAPHVAGAIAVLAAAEPGLTPDQIVDRLENTGTPVSVTRGLTTYTIPRLNLGAAMQPNITAAPVSLEFGTIPAGSVSSLQSVNINSNGLGNVSISSVSLDGSDPTAFEIVGDSCTSNSWPSYSSGCTLGVRFLAQSAGTRSAKLTFTSNDPVPPEVALTGTSGVFNPLPPIRLLHTAQMTYYNTDQPAALQNALNAAVDGDVIQMRSIGITEMLFVDRAGQQISLEGGFDGSYTNQNDLTTLQGGMILKAGKVVARNLKIR